MKGSIPNICLHRVFSVFSLLYGVAARGREIREEEQDGEERSTSRYYYDYECDDTYGTIREINIENKPTTPRETSN